MKLKEVFSPLFESFRDAKKKFLAEWPEHLVIYALEDFHTIRKRLSPPENDISYWIKEGFYPFFLMVQKEKKKKTRGQRRKEIKQTSEYETIFSDDFVTITVPLTTESACKLGHKTDWCISIRTPSENRFKQYTLENSKVYFIFEVDDIDELSVRYLDAAKYGNPYVPTYVDHLKTFTIEVGVGNKSVMLWDTNNDGHKLSPDVVSDTIWLITSDDSYDYNYFIEKARSLYPQIREKLESDSNKFYDELLDNPSINTLEDHYDNSQITSIGDSDEISQFFGNDYEKLADAIIVNNLLSGTNIDLDVVGKHESVFNLPNGVDDLITQMVLNGTYDASSIEMLQHGTVSLGDDPAATDLFYDVRSESFHGLAEQYVETGNGFVQYLAFFDVFYDLIDDVLEEDKNNESLHPSKVLKRRIINDPYDESTLNEDFNKLASSPKGILRDLGIESESLYKELVSIKNKRVRYGDTQEHPELNLSYQTLYVSSTGDRVVKPIDGDKFMDHYNIDQHGRSIPNSVLEEFSIAILDNEGEFQLLMLIPYVKYRRKANDTFYPLSALVGSSDESVSDEAVKWALDYVKDKTVEQVLSSTPQTLGELQNRFFYIMKFVKQRIFTENESKNILMSLLEQAEKHDDDPYKTINFYVELFERHHENIHGDVLLVMLKNLRQAALDATDGNEYNKNLTPVARFNDMLQQLYTSSENINRRILNDLTINITDDNNNEI